MPRLVCLLALVGLSLVAAAPAAAHVTARPTFIGSGGRATIDLKAPNERAAPMTGFMVTVPEGIALVSAASVGDWDPTIAGRLAIWSGGSLEKGEAEAFPLTIEAEAPPGTVELRAAQSYAGGATARWTVPLTVVPGTPAASGSNGWALLMVFLSILALSAAIAVARARKARSLEE